MRSKKLKQKRSENPRHSLRGRHCDSEGTDSGTDRDSDGVSPVRDRHHQGPKGSRVLSTRGTRITATDCGPRRRCRGGDSSVESRSNIRHRNKKDSGRRNRRVRESRIEVSSSDIEGDGGGFHRRGRATEPSRHAPPAGSPHRGHRGHEEKAVRSAHKNREVASPRRESRHKPHPDRVHSPREKYRHRPKVTELLEGSSQGGKLKSCVLPHDPQVMMAARAWPPFWLNLPTALNIITGQTVTSYATCRTLSRAERGRCYRSWDLTRQFPSLPSF